MTTLLPGARIGSNCHLRTAIVEECVSVPHGTWLGDRAVPDAGLCEVSDCGVTVLYGFDERPGRREPGTQTDGRLRERPKAGTGSIGAARAGWNAATEAFDVRRRA